MLKRIFVDIPLPRACGAFRCGLRRLHTIRQSGARLILFMLKKNTLSLYILDREALLLLSPIPYV